MTDSRNPALARLLRSRSTAQAFQLLVADLPGADLTSMLLGVAAERVKEVSPADVLRNYENDRFVAPGPLDGLTMAQIELDALASVSGVFEPITLAPLAPFGAHAALGQTPQNNVITTQRMSEVAADPTNSLALEAAVRRRKILADAPRSTEAVLLAATLRVTRAQVFEGPRSFAHFSLLGLVSAGRDEGNYSCETHHVELQVRTLIDVIRSQTMDRIHVSFSPFRPETVEHCERLCDVFASSSVSCELDPEREHGRAYYRSICFKLAIEHDGERFELGDGGDVWWTQELLSSRKERLMIAGLGLERLAMLAATKVAAAQSVSGQ